MTSRKKRTLGLIAAAVVGLAVGAAFSPASASQDLHLLWASYPEYDTADDLLEASDVAIRGTVLDNGTPYVDFGIHADDDPAVEGDGVAMRLFNVQVMSPDGENEVTDEIAQVATLDTASVVALGSPRLGKGDSVFLYLEEVSNETFTVDLVVGKSYYVVVGGRQGVFREADGRVWIQDADPAWAFVREEGEPVPEPLVVDENYVTETASS